MKAEASAAEAKFEKLAKAGTKSWTAWSAALTESRTAFDRANQVGMGMTQAGQLASLTGRLSAIGTCTPRDLARDDPQATKWSGMTKASHPAQRSKSPKASPLEVQFGQPVPVEQHDLALGLAEEAEDAHAVKM